MRDGFVHNASTPAEILHNVRKVGRFDWLGGYAHAVLLSDGEVLGPECVAPNYREISHATRHGERSGWAAVAVIALDGADEPEHCAHCYKLLDGPPSTD